MQDNFADNEIPAGFVVLQRHDFKELAPSWFLFSPRQMFSRACGTFLILEQSGKAFAVLISGFALCAGGLWSQFSRLQNLPYLCGSSRKGEQSGEVFAVLLFERDGNEKLFVVPISSMFTP